MKKTLLTLTALAVMATAGMIGIVPGTITSPAELRADSHTTERVVIYQFHRRFRCEACYTLEKAINETLETHFSTQVANDKLVYKVIDLDAGGGKKFEKRYDFFYNTVIITVMRGDEDLKFKNIEEVWQLTEDKGKLIEYVKTELEEYLKEL